MSIKNLFYWSYWFQQPMVLKNAAMGMWLVFFLVLVAAGLVALFMRAGSNEQAFKNFLNRVAGLGLTMGIFGLVWLFFRQEHIPFLAWRVWLGIWVMVFVVWVIPLLKYFVKRLPAVRAENAARMEKERYMR